MKPITGSCSTWTYQFLCKATFHHFGVLKEYNLNLIKIAGVELIGTNQVFTRDKLLSYRFGLY